MYPMRRYNSELRYEINDIGQKIYFAINMKQEEMEVTRHEFDELSNADGTHPLDLPENVLYEFEDFGLITTKRLVDDEWGRHLCILPVGQRRSEKIKPLADILDVLHRIALVIFPAVAIIASLLAPAVLKADFSVVLFVALFVLSIFLHEVGHLITALHFGNEVSEIGIPLGEIGQLYGGCVFYNDSGTTRFEEARISLAGIEANIIFACVCLIIRALFPRMSYLLLLESLLNFILVIENLIPSRLSDGRQFLEALLDVQNIEWHAQRILRSERRRNIILQRGLKGHAQLFLLRLVRHSNICRVVVSLLIIILWFGFVL